MFKKTAVCVALLGVMGCFGGGSGTGAESNDTMANVTEASLESSITLVNDSDYAIHYLYMSSTSEQAWGPDQLGQNVIASNGGVFTLTGIACDSYDVKLVDEDGDECVVSNVDVCAEDSGWHITNEDLLRCQGFIH